MYKDIQDIRIFKSNGFILDILNILSPSFFERIQIKTAEDIQVLS